MALTLAKRMSVLKRSEIREILKITQQPEVISFAGGLPAPELFPMDAIEKVQSQVLQKFSTNALQYSTTEGFPPLRDWIANRMNKRFNTSMDADNIMITHGSQQALDLAGKVFLDSDDVVLCESPTYLAALSAFLCYGCSFKEIPTDHAGMDMDALEKALQTTPRAKLIYIIPDFQNPTGKTWSLERRKQIAALAEKYNIAVLEDSPYAELRFEGEPLPSVQSFDAVGNILFAGSFSKIFCPGYRIGWIAGDKEIIEKFVLVKQSTDLQCNTSSQMVIAKFLKYYDIDAHIATICATYKKRRDVLLECLDKEMPEGVTFVRPEGGLFSWVELPEHIDASKVLLDSLEQKVAFVPGEPFFPNSGKKNTFRLNFSCMSEDLIKEGMSRLGYVIRKHLDT